jgi:hypothetical protein
MSWLFSQVLVAEYLGENYLDGEQSVPLSGNSTQLAYLPQDKMTDFSRLSRFGMMFKPLTEQLGKELLMSYQAAFRAKTSLPQEKVQELTESVQECGKRWQGLLARYDPNTHSLRTVQCSLFEDLNQSLQTWPRWGSMRNGECFQQPMLVQIIQENEFGLSVKYPTPTVGMVTGGQNPEKGGQVGLGYMARKNKWPTPDANCGQRGTQPKWTTKRPSGHPAQYSINQAVRDVEQNNGGPLNPMWVEWLMGWPLGWTDLKPLETDKSLCVPQQHGTSLKED